MKIHSGANVAQLRLGIEVLPDDLVAVHLDAQQLPQLRDIALGLRRSAAAEHAHHAARRPLRLRRADDARRYELRPGKRIFEDRRRLARSSRLRRNCPSPPA